MPQIVARIQKFASDLYYFDGRTFDNFVSARRAMTDKYRKPKKLKTKSAAGGMK